MQTESYNRIANEYYEPRHITSRNFDAATESACANRDFPIPKNGLVLEVGAGKGSAKKYCKVENSRIVQTDLAEDMLALSPREDFLLALRCDALDMPFISSSFSTVLAFLYDPFNLPPFYFEISRVLKPGGIFVGTLPHFKWGLTLRKKIGYPLHKTKFKLFQSVDEEYIELDSFLMDDQEITQTLSDAGLATLELIDLMLPESVKNISPHIVIPADVLEITPYELPIVKLIIARKL